jgi:hypothetical protein
LNPNSSSTFSFSFQYSKILFEESFGQDGSPALGATPSRAATAPRENLINNHPPSSRQPTSIAGPLWETESCPPPSDPLVKRSRRLFSDDVDDASSRDNEAITMPPDAFAVLRERTANHLERSESVESSGISLAHFRSESSLANPRVYRRSTSDTHTITNRQVYFA